MSSRKLESRVDYSSESLGLAFKGKRIMTFRLSGCTLYLYIYMHMYTYIYTCKRRTKTMQLYDFWDWIQGIVPGFKYHTFVFVWNCTLKEPV